MKIIIPVAGLGSRLKPHTFSTPKPLMIVAGKPILEYVLDEVSNLKPDEVILVVGYHKEKVQEYVENKFPELNVKFVEQKVMDGDGGAIRLALQNTFEDDSLYIIFGADTLVDFNLKKELQKNKNSDLLIFGMEVENPEHYGVMNIDENLNVYEVEEKPMNPKSNLAIIGAYYFKSALKVKESLNHFYEKEIKVKDEYKLVQVIGKYIRDKNLTVVASKVVKWFDCGRPEVLLEANKYFLEKKKTLTGINKKGNSIIISPSYVSISAKLDRCIIGPNVSIGDNVELKNVIVENSVIGKNSIITGFVLKNSLIGREVFLLGSPTKYNIGDKSEIKFKSEN